MNGQKNGVPLAAQEGWANQEGWGSELGRISPEPGFTPLNLEPSSAPVPRNMQAPVHPSTASSPVLGRATSSKKCLLLACFAAVATIALGVGLGVGLSGSDSSTSTSSGGGGSSGNGGGSSEATTATVYGATLSSECQEMATINYWEVVDITEYDLSLKLTEEMFQYNASTGAAPMTFAGKATLLFRVQQQAAGCVVLNARNLTFRSIALQAQLPDGSLSPAAPLCNATGGGCDAGGAVVSPTFQRRASSSAEMPLSTGDTDLVAISLGGTVVEPGTVAALVFEYTGVLGAWPTGTLGLYRSAPFPTADGDGLEVMVVTQGETTGARQMLPCYDQPARKAVFEVTLQVPSKTPAGTDMVALSNMPARNKLGGSSDAIHIYEFEPTPVMSPYLLAVAAGDLVQYKQAGGGNATGAAAGLPELRFWAAPGLEGQLAEAAQVVPLAFQFYSAYFENVSQPAELTKYDLVAVPGRQGAMENWGLMLFDENRFLYDKDWEGAYGRKLLVLVVCHEVAHQWVGNLATKQDWAMLSVDEGLATFLEYKCIESMDGYQGQGNVHFFRGSTPQLQNPGLHEAPGFLALQNAAEPTSPAMVPASDLDIGTGGYMQYSKPAAVIQSHELFLRESSGGINVMPSIMTAMLQQGSYGTWNWSQYFVAVRDTIAAANTTQGNSLVKTVESRAGTFMAAQNYSAVMDIIASGTPTIATWFYSPLYPIIRVDENSTGNGYVVSWNPDPPNPPQLLADDPTNATLLSMWNYNETLYSLGGTSRPFCSFEISQELAGQLGVADLASRLQAPCSFPEGQRYFPLAVAMDNLTSCSREGNHAGRWAARFGELIQTPTWVDSQQGARLMRSVYNESHFSALLGVMADMTDICETDAESNTTCCTRQGDLLEGAAVLSDALALAMTGHSQPVAAGVTGVTVLQAVEAAVKDGGAPRDGQWQYLIGRAALDSLFQIKRYAGWVAKEQPECSSDFGEYIRAVTKNMAAALSAEWLQTSVESNDTLKQLIGPRMLWPLALVEAQPLTLYMCEEFTLTPLWMRLLDVLAGGPGDTGLQLQPGGAAGDTPEVSADLLPALYMIGGALPASCNASLLEGEGIPDGTALADLAVPLLQAMQRCYLTDPSNAEAQRCLYAMPFAASLAETDDFQAQPQGSVAVAAMWKRTLPWLLATTNVSGCGEFASDPTLYARCMRRAADLTPELSALANTLTRVSSAHYAAFVQFLEESWSPQAGTSLCGLLSSTVPPMSPKTYDQLIALLTAGPAKDCQAGYKLRTAGMAEQMKEVYEAHAADACQYVAQQLEAWADEAGGT